MSEQRDSKSPRGEGGPRVVAFGGGHGMHACLSALRRLTDHLTAIVTVADDGGSSGRIREELGGLPPGDLRMALAALCGDDEWGRTWARALQHRFGGAGHLSGHALGNLLITALWEELGEPVAALEWVGRLLGARGRVLPMAAVPLEIEARVRGVDPQDPLRVSTVRGQHSLAKTPGEVLTVRLLPNDPPAVPDALEAIDAADWAVLGPGSWFTSVLPHLMVPELAESLLRTDAKRLLVLNLVPQIGETDGFTPADHVEVLAAHAPGLRLDAILVDPSSLRGPHETRKLEEVAATMGARVHIAAVAALGPEPYHDPIRLAEAIADIIDEAAASAGETGHGAGQGEGHGAGQGTVVTGAGTGTGSSGPGQGASATAGVSQSQNQNQNQNQSPSAVTSPVASQSGPTAAGMNQSQSPIASPVVSQGGPTAGVSQSPSAVAGPVVSQGGPAAGMSPSHSQSPMAGPVVSQGGPVADVGQRAAVGAGPDQSRAQSVGSGGIGPGIAPDTSPGGTARPKVA